ncbi:RNA-directed DNA polymerase from mobile element jockey [Eumeta japonica]|uniref:RNA-directed DNA polymerase from mobile element jockey n=1 Tax=Eumeta variegata TaxID=151549 RepID=A0A4C1VSM2_EUMVA|nr:RNA-directed DNA polymerase from mobile element jockey [Eumeta japonica]
MVHSIFPHLHKAIDELDRWFQNGSPSLRIHNSLILWQGTYKYLGITLDRNLRYRDNIKRIRKTTIFYLNAMLRRRSKLSLCNKRTIYIMCIRMVMIHASPVFAYGAPIALNELQVLQNKFCISATNAH